MEKENKEGTLSDKAAAKKGGPTFGDSILDSQTQHQAFTKVNEEWIKQCRTFEQMLADARKFQITCKDIDGVKLHDIQILRGRLMCLNWKR